MKTALLFTFIVLLYGCSSVELPKEKYSQFTETKSSIKAIGDSVRFELYNSLECPVRYYFTQDNKPINGLHPLLLTRNTDTVVSISKKEIDTEKLNGKVFFGDLNRTINTTTPLSLPFSYGKTYKVLQAYNGSFSHNSDYSRYAIDFNLKINDTVCAADDGYVIGVIKDYTGGGKTKEWRDYANFITIYHPHSGIYTQYVHLAHQGSFVQVGDRVKRGDAIGLSGNTGMANGEHLHFNVLVPAPTGEGLISVKTEFIEGYEGKFLKRGDIVRRF